MKKSGLLIFALCFGAAGFVAFTKDKDKDKDRYCQTKNGITVTEGDHAFNYPDAKLKLNDNKNVRDTGMNTFTYEVSGYQLGEQTPDASKMCANSAKGQHIHFILDNQPYYASYTPTIEQKVKPGHHVLLSFLSRSYHESLKHKEAYVLTQFNTAGNTEKTDLSKPMMFYSRPKGAYTGENEIKKLLLDFYLVNTDLEKHGFKVKATIDGNDFMLDKWKPYYIEGLKPGKHKIRLQLLDKKGNVVPGKFNDSGDREIELIAGDPIKNMK